MAEKRENPALTADTALFSIIDKDLKILLIKRGNPPFQDKWALPGGFVDPGEEIRVAAERELEEETGVKYENLEQVQTFGTPGRDPRGRTVSVVYFALADSSGLKTQADTDAKEVAWVSVNDLPELAFDHAEIIKYTIKVLRQKLENTPAVKSIMPGEFNLDRLREVYEVILNKTFEPEVFKRKIAETGLLEKTASSKYKFREGVEFAGRFI